MLVAYVAPVVLPAAREVAHLLDHRRHPTSAHSHGHSHARPPGVEPADQHEAESRHVAGTAHVHGPGGAHVHGGLAGGLLALADAPRGEVGPEPGSVRTSVDAHAVPLPAPPLRLSGRRTPVPTRSPTEPAAAPDLLPPTPPPRA